MYGVVSKSPPRRWCFLLNHDVLLMKNAKVASRAFNKNKLQWKIRTEARKDTTHGKFVSNLEGTFRVTENLVKSKYHVLRMLVIRNITLLESLLYKANQ